MKMFRMVLMIIMSVIVTKMTYAESIHTEPNISGIGDLTAEINLFGDVVTGSQFGMNAEWDLTARLGIVKNGDILVSPMGWGVIRYDLTFGAGFGILGLYLDPSSVGLQYCLNLSFGSTLGVSALISGYTTYEDFFSELNWDAVFAPYLNLGEKLSVFFEVTPYGWVSDTSDFADTMRFDLRLMPGLSVKLGIGEFAFGIGIDGFLYRLDPLDITYSAKYSIEFDDIISYEETVSDGE